VSVWKVSYGNKLWRCNSWQFVAIIIIALLLITNYELLSGRSFPKWDAEEYSSCYQMLIADFIRAGELLLWNPLIRGGAPDFIDPGLGTLSPITLIIAFITGGGGRAFVLYWIIIWCLGGIGFLLLGRHLGAPPWVALIVAMGFIFSGFFTGHAEHMSWINSMSFLPWIIWRFDAAIQRGSWLFAVQAGVLWGLSGVGGYPLFTIMIGLYLSLWLLGRTLFLESGEKCNDNTSYYKKLILLFLLTSSVAFIVLAPTYVSFSIEGKGYTDRAGFLLRDVALHSNSLRLGALGTLITPFINTLKCFNPWLWPENDVSSSNIYFGWIVIVFIIFALISSSRNKWRVFLFIMSLFWLAVSLGSDLPIRGWLYDLFPPSRYFRHSSGFSGFAMVSMAILALYGGKDLDGFINGENRNSHEIRTFYYIILLLTIIADLYILIFFLNYYLLLNLDNIYSFVGFLHILIVWHGLLIVSLLALRINSLTKIYQIIFPVIIFAVIDAGFSYFISLPTISVKNENIARRYALYDKLHKTSLNLSDSEMDRLASYNDLTEPDNTFNFPSKIAVFSGYTPMKNSYQELIYSNPVLRAMAIGRDRIWFSPCAITTKLSHDLVDSMREFITRKGAPPILIHSKNDMLDPHRGQDTRGIDPHRIFSLEPAQAVRIKELIYEPNRLEFTVEIPQDGWLLVTDRWSRSWRAAINGQPTEIWGGNFIFRALKVSKGWQCISFHYSLSWFWLLLSLSWGAIVFTVVWSLMSLAGLTYRPIESRMKEA
jgi:hypothetical protein